MKKQDRIKQYKLTTIAIKQLINSYKVHDRKCSLCTTFVYNKEEWNNVNINDTTPTKVALLKNKLCKSCPNQSFNSLIGICGAKSRKITPSYTSDHLTLERRNKSIKFWISVLNLFIENKESVVDKMNGDKTYNKNTWLAKAIRHADEYLDDKYQRIL